VTQLTVNNLTVKPGHTVNIGSNEHGAEGSHLQIYGDIMLNGQGLSLIQTKGKDPDTGTEFNMYVLGKKLGS